MHSPRAYSADPQPQPPSVREAYCERRLSATVWTGVVVWTVTLIHLAFVNVFVTNLYEKSALGGGRRRLHGVHRGADGAVSLVEAPVFKEEDTRLAEPLGDARRARAHR